MHKVSIPLAVLVVTNTTALTGPERCRSVAFDFNEEFWCHGTDSMDKVFTAEESAGAEVQAGTDPFTWVRPVFWIKGCCDRCVC